MGYAKRADRNQQEVMNAYRGLGCSVESIHRLGHGIPDLLVGVAGVTDVVEVKDGNGELTEDEREWHAAWRGSKRVVRTLEEVGQHVRELKARRNDGPKTLKER